MYGVVENLDGKVAVLLCYRVLMPTAVYEKDLLVLYLVCNPGLTIPR
jgi:hypothetical protein